MNMTRNKLKMIPCISCQEGMPELRLTKYGYKLCVECSDVGAYRAVSTINGSGDHTWNDIQIMTPDQHSTFKSSQSKNTKWDKYSDE